ncbi:MAG: ABC transporter ATP-binding protein [Lachnospiraceae bacterium]|nr:ABC transporter ATP-binding protein [Lachnospiraceae bacterium]
MLSVKDVHKSYEKSEVLHGVSLNVNPGEIHGLIGENSAGKTTLIKCIVGIYRTDAGTITVDEKPVFDNPDAKRRIGYVADYNEYFSFYSAKRMVALYNDFYPKFDVDKFNALNEIFTLPLEKNISSLSKGQKMRLAIMLEIAKKPEYLILDEPTSGLDPSAKKAFYKLLTEEVDENGTGVLISSHNLDGLEKVCDSVTMIHAGKVEKQMNLEALKEELTKIHAIFENGASPEIYRISNVLQVSNVGSIYTFIIQNYNDETEAVLKQCGAGFIENVPLSLEEVFVTLEKNRKE